MAAQQPYPQQGQGALPPGTTQHVVQQPAVYPTQPYVQQQPGGYPTAAYMYGQQQPQTIIITQPTYAPQATLYPTYRAKSAKILGALQITAGLLSIILTITGIVLNVSTHVKYYTHFNFTFYIAPGIWCSFFVSTGKPALKPPVYKDHLVIKITFYRSPEYTFHVMEPAHKRAPVYKAHKLLILG